MEPKEMRKELKAAGLKCPVKNVDVIREYKVAFDTREDAAEIAELEATEKEKAEISTKNIVTLASSNIYTYIGQGDEPPHMITFMGKQRFVRGDATEVTDLEVLGKIKINPCFVKGKINKDILFENDKIASQKVEAQREEDVKIQIEMDRKNRG